MAASLGWFFSFACLCCFIKLLLLPSYRSTDFEVHRNWLAVTHSLPISDWYYEETSEWTLDYPPFFAWFEYAMSFVARVFDKDMLVVTNLNHASKATVLFQRLSVIVTDLVLIFAVYSYVTQSLHETGKGISLRSRAFLLTILLLFNFGLIVVDHIHFQYNGFLFGILLLSIQKITMGKTLQGAFLFAVLLNFKHLFLYIAPAYFVFLLREYCFPLSKTPSRLARAVGVDIAGLKVFRLAGLGVVVLSVFLLSFGPFILMGDIGQIISRLFPVKRGLCHAYWAANFWSLYNIADKALVIIGTKLKLIDKVANQASMTGGLVAQQEHVILPSVSALATAVITIATMLFKRNLMKSAKCFSKGMLAIFHVPVLLRGWYKPAGSNGFIRSLVICAYCSFLFGYHVHEKAIIMVIFPFCLLAVQSERPCRPFLLLSIPGHYALFPLIFQPFETPIKVALFIAYSLISCAALANLHGTKAWSFGIPFVNSVEALYIWGLVPLHVYCNAIHPAFGLEKRLPFIPLLMTSVYCTVGVIWSWFLFYKDAFTPDTKTIKLT